MRIAAIIPFTGSEKLVKMTEDCIAQLLQCKIPTGWGVQILAWNNGASRPIELPTTTDPGFALPMQMSDYFNMGFGVGINRAIDYLTYGESMSFEAYLLLNNDLQFPQKDWLVRLLEEYQDNYVTTPRTDVTATPEACQPGPADKIPTRLRQVSAYCWLVPSRIQRAIETRFQFPLFCPLFTNYGSDDATAAILRKLYGETPFKLVNRSWVKHLKAQTANELRVKAGTTELLKDLQKWIRLNKLPR